MQDEELHSLLTKGRIVDNLKAKYRFHPNVVVISVERIVNKGGKQLDLLDTIEEATKRCDGCGFDIIGLAHEVLDENYEVQEGIFMCGSCKFGDE